MKSQGFPGCCTATILYDFGGTKLSMGDRFGKTKTQIRGYLRKKINELKNYHCLVIITNNQQDAANEVLEELGFQHSKWMSKVPHPESKIRLWWRPPKGN